jgi:hypothetical protein
MEDDIPDIQTPTDLDMPEKKEEGQVIDLQHNRMAELVFIGESLREMREYAIFPESAEIHAISPNGGFRVVLKTQKRTPGELITAVQKMQEWLFAAGYTSPYASPEIPF